MYGCVYEFVCISHSECKVNCVHTYRKLGCSLQGKPSGGGDKQEDIVDAFRLMMS